MLSFATRAPPAANCVLEQPTGPKHGPRSPGQLFYSPIQSPHTCYVTAPTILYLACDVNSHSPPPRYTTSFK